MTEDELDAARKEIAEARGFCLWRLYREKEAARFIGCDYATLARKRLKGEVPCVKERVQYAGYMIADIILSGMGSPPNSPKSSGSTSET